MPSFPRRRESIGRQFPIKICINTHFSKCFVVAYDEGLAQPGVRVMDFTGKPMRGYVFVNAEAIESDNPLTFWLQHCLAFVQTLPPKKPKAAKTATKTATTTVAKKVAKK